MAELSERVEAELENIKEAIDALPEAEELADLSVLELAGVSALLHSFYNGVENILKHIMRARGLTLPAGQTWHRDLIEAASKESIVSEATKEGLKEFLAFRHFFSHAYAFHVEADRLEPLVEAVPGMFGRFRDELESFMRPETDTRPRP